MQIPDKMRYVMSIQDAVDKDRHIRLSDRELATRVIFLTLTATALIILDGVLTYIGLERGVAGEGNALLRFFMESYGVLVTLVVAKGLSVVALMGVGWYGLEKHGYANMVCFALCGIVVTYTVLAIIPWMYYLS